jgi:hypothetical protein
MMLLLLLTVIIRLFLLYALIPDEIVVTIYEMPQ